MSLNELLFYLGIDAKLLTAGFAGGVVHTFFFRQTDPYTVIGSVVSGMFTANFLAEPLATLTHLSVGPAGFAAGFGAMAICQGFVSMIKAKIGVRDDTEPKPGAGGI